MKTQWSYVVLCLGVFAGLVFLVYEGKIDSNLLTVLVSAVSGGGLYHAGAKASGSGGDNQG